MPNAPLCAVHGKSHLFIAFTVTLLAALLPAAATAQSDLPIIDMHLHTLWFGAGLEEPLTGFVAPDGPEQLREQTIAELDRFHIVKAVASGDQLDAYRAALGDRLLPGVVIYGPDDLTPDSLRALHRAGDLAVLAEFAPQYSGLSANDPSLEPYWSLAEELDIPVGIHMGPGPPGAAYAGYPEYRIAHGSALLLEDVLVRHPRLRVYVMHAGWPLLDDMVGLLYAHPQVHVDVGVIDWVLPAAEFHAYLRRLVDAGFGKRILFGSDNIVWPQSFERAIDRIMSASFLSEEQRRDILCENAMRFLRLPSTTCEPE